MVCARAISVSLCARARTESQEEGRRDGEIADRVPKATDHHIVWPPRHECLDQRQEAHRKVVKVEDRVVVLQIVCVCKRGVGGEDCAAEELHAERDKKGNPQEELPEDIRGAADDGGEGVGDKGEVARDGVDEVDELEDAHLHRQIHTHTRARIMRGAIRKLGGARALCVPHVRGGSASRGSCP